MTTSSGELEQEFHAWIRLRAEGARNEVVYHHAMDLAYQKSQTDDVDGYLGALDRALAALPGDPDALYRKGLKLLQLGRLDESKAVLELADRHRSHEMALEAIAALPAP